jgi:hypothetical protein
MRWTLKRHPDSRPGAVTGVDVEVGHLSGNQVRLRYVVSGAIDQLLIPAPADPERTDQLWRSTFGSDGASNMIGMKLVFKQTKFLIYNFN